MVFEIYAVDFVGRVREHQSFDDTGVVNVESNGDGRIEECKAKEEVA